MNSGVIGPQLNVPRISIGNQKLPGLNHTAPLIRRRHLTTSTVSRTVMKRAQQLAPKKNTYCPRQRGLPRNLFHICETGNSTQP